ncbi:PPA1309 family protein [Ornithinimicrobium sufpigmenti]|uniref:PPA1309 family protein n=1 Tax=Ornithinimicrobium sufpigmenti TaxID=2508882 RepID=UPI001EDCD538|nr:MULTISPECIES: PPA1309 family protein [unclassified Ornithinimicrobium]
MTDLPESSQSSQSSSSPGSSRPQDALLRAAVDTERHVARLGWDQPPRLFALVRTGLLREREPSMASQLQQADDDGYTAVEQEGLPPTSDLESLLGRMAWPEDVEGVAMAVERIVVPPEAEQDLPEEPDAATDRLAAHPDRKDVRLLAACLRDGRSICLLRQRDHDSDDAVAVGQDIAPGLTHALAMTLRD